jgi:uncharacterized membrane protein
MTRRQRVIAYGSAAAFAVLGLLCAIVISGMTAEVIGWTAFTLGFGAIVLLVFYEIGLSEDRDREREAAERDAALNRPRSRRPSPRSRRASRSDHHA